MRFLQNLKIRTKFLFLPILVATCTALFGVFSISILNTQKARLSHVVQHDLARINELSNLLSQLTTNHLRTFDLLASAQTGLDEESLYEIGKMYLNRMHEITSQFNGIGDRFPLTDEERTVHTNLREELSRYGHVLALGIEMTTVNLTLATQHMVNANRSYNKVNELSLILLDRTRRQSNSAIIGVLEEFDRRGAQFAVLIAIAVMSLGAVTVTISHFLSREIIAISRITTELAMGDKSVAIPYVGRKDEIGTMAEATQVFKRNLIRLAESEATTLALNQELEEEIRERRQAQEALQRANEDLERRVEERTAELRGANERLQQEAEERRRAEETVAQQSALLQATLDNISQGVSVFDKNLRLVAWNQRFLELREPPRALAQKGRPFVDFLRHSAASGEYGPGDPEEQVAERLADARSCEPHCFERTRPNGRVVEFRRNPMPGGGFATTYTDITERKQADQMKTDFVSFVTHQLRTPLSGIKWMLELAAQEKNLPAEAGSYVTDAQAASERLIRLVNDLLDVSRLERGKLTIVPEETRLGELTQGVLTELAPLIAEKGHQLSVTGAAEVPPVWVDPQLLQQVILNLTSNAIKYTPPGGEIAIRMGLEDAAVCWAVRDSGIGVPKEAQERLFEKFYRADNVYAIETEGTGLGLYLVRLIVMQFDGRVWCESEEGKGATFTFTLPLRKGG